MRKTKIDWVEYECNPAMGCPNGCEYCYARKLNTRFKWIEDWSKPQFFPERLKDFYSKKPKSIFIDSMSDIGTWKSEWLEKVGKAVVDNPQHRYIALTKCPQQLSEKLLSMADPFRHQFFESVFWGTSITTQAQADSVRNKLDFFSIEPILQSIVLQERSFPKTLIIGAETGNRKGKAIPQKEWITSLVAQADKHNSIVFMKESLRKIMGDDFRQDKLPWEIEK